MKIQKTLYRVVLGAVSLAVLILIRKYQTELFDDPFLEYFASDAQNKTYPTYHSFSMYAGLILRWILNSTFSILFLTALFWKKSISVSSIKIFTVFGLIIFLLYAVQIEMRLPLGEKIAFFTRRLLIQPLLLLILIPVYYFQLKSEKI